MFAKVRKPSPMIELLGLIGAIILPFWNIPMIITIGKRRSSKDISLAWTWGIFICLVIMLPAGLRSPDPTFRIFSVLNVLFFAGVVVQVLRFRR